MRLTKNQEKRQIVQTLNRLLVFVFQSFISRFLIFIGLVLVSNSLLKHLNVLDLMPWELLFGIGLGALFIHYRNFPIHQAKSDTKMHTPQNNKTSTGSSKSIHSSTRSHLSDQQMESKISKQIDHLLSLSSSPSSQTDTQTDPISNVSSSGGTKSKKQDQILSKSRTTNFDEFLEQISCDLNQFFKQENGSPSMAPELGKSLSKLLSGIPIVYFQNCLYILKSKHFTLQQENQLSQLIEFLEKINPEMEIKVIIGNNVKNHLIYVSFTDMQSETVQFELPLSFMSLN
jgi:hypothetical protein